jgi:hypothetical protein
MQDKQAEQDKQAKEQAEDKTSKPFSFSFSFLGLSGWTLAVIPLALVMAAVCLSAVLLIH